MKFRGLAFEIILIIFIIFVAGLLFLFMTPVIERVIAVGLEMGLDTDVANTVDSVWKFLPFFVLASLVLFLFLVAMRRQPYEENYYYY